MVGGRLADRIGERHVLIASGLITGGAALLAALVSSFSAFLFTGFLLGLGTGVQNPAGSAAVMRWFPLRRRGLAWSQPCAFTRDGAAGDRPAGASAPVESVCRQFEKGDAP
jgi:MFS family permease